MLQEILENRINVRGPCLINLQPANIRNTMERPMDFLKNKWKASYKVYQTSQVVQLIIKRGLQQQIAWETRP